MLRPEDYPLPVEFERAYQAAEKIVFEADPGQLNSPKMQQLIAHKAFYHDGTTLEDILQPQTYRLLQEHCQRRNLQLSAFIRLKPAMASLTLLAIELQRHGIVQGGVDLHFYQKSVTDGREREALETMEQQMEFMMGMAQGREDRFMQHSLGELNRLDEIFHGLIVAWRGGDEKAIARLVTDDFKGQFPEIYGRLFSERNAAWLPVIKGFIETPETELILVGVGHLVGEEGLVEALRRDGYQVQKLQL
ncbi:TraB/GumN family protein [Syntrophotalea acetylenivorans]|uniref:TraB/GumN family protein n=1 Tax=Syntrophotalea acetylenivorans TaxID=1842532 RepID=UPI0009F8EE19|nr:TraB/GumN family protein [Syntrophotalea acetylenivorans]